MDDLDRAVIGCLLRDARSTYAEVGDQVGLSAPAIKRRVDRLVASGAIRGFTAVIDPAALGWHTEAYMELSCKGAVSPQHLRELLDSVPEVVDACTVSGSADAVVHMLAEDMQMLERAIERIRLDPSVERSQTTIVLSRLIDRPRA